MTTHTRWFFIIMLDRLVSMTKVGFFFATSTDKSVIRKYLEFRILILEFKPVGSVLDQLDPIVVVLLCCALAWVVDWQQQ